MIDREKIAELAEYCRSTARDKRAGASLLRLGLRAVAGELESLLKEEEEEAYASHPKPKGA